jgi:hypothetical protein
VNQIASDDELRTALHAAVGPVTASSDMLDRVRAGAARRRRRTQVMGSAAAVVGLAAGVSFATFEPGFTPFDDSAAGMTSADCAQLTGPHFLPAINVFPGDRHLVPGAPIAAVACDVVTDSSAEPSKPWTSTPGRRTVLRGSDLKRVINALNSSQSGDLSDDSPTPLHFDTVTIEFIYRSHQTVSVTIPLWDTKATTTTSRGGQAHFWPKTIPGAIKALAS